MTRVLPGPPERSAAACGSGFQGHRNCDFSSGRDHVQCAPTIASPAAASYYDPYDAAAAYAGGTRLDVFFFFLRHYDIVVGRLVST